MYYHHAEALGTSFRRRIHRSPEGGGGGGVVGVGVVRVVEVTMLWIMIDLMIDDDLMM